ncbi:hypothetical protein [Amycolatopsis nigrescens]|uniref:hypothetical protein n=1 Tax=Amycolatopsis nigrescens TaxID=381445 RepID=UPI000377B9B8|nr:hypothetical protein [Amycolatopsis nigrescens]
MWVDESGSADTTDTTGASDQMAISVEGQEYSAEVNFDLDQDGTDETARIEHEDGTVVGYSDTDHDGRADQYLHVDAQGNVLESARFDEASGQWVATDPEGPGAPGDSTDTSGDGGMTADMQEGDVNVGPATVDSDHDGRNDTAVVQDDQGNTRMFTDVDGDGKADVQTIVDPSGNSTTYSHTGDGEWTEMPPSSGVAPAPSSDQVWGWSSQDTVEGVAKIDSATGQWISQN